MHIAQKINPVAILISVLFSHASTAASPNIILLLADDQGWTGTSVQMDPDIAVSKSDLYRTPSLERLASEGMIFSNGYSPAPNCSPTRMSIQTGKTAPRLGATDIIDVSPEYFQGREPDYGAMFYRLYYENKPLDIMPPISKIADEELTIGEMLKKHDRNYVTAHIGKWHMDGGDPSRHGYDVHDGLTTNGEGQQGMPDPKRTSELTIRAMEFLDKQAASGDPFFMQVSYYAVHTPVLAHPETIDRYNSYESTQHVNSLYGAMTDELDQSLGKILARLDDLELTEDTYVIYTSDNGGEMVNSVTNNYPLAKGKTHVWDGGIRVPLVIRGPKIDAGSRSDVPVTGYDFFPTIAEWIDYKDKLPEDIDGGSIVSVLENSGSGEVRRGTKELIWYYSAYRNIKYVAPQAAIRDGQYKLVWELDSDRINLYDLDADIGETTNLERYHPDIAHRLLNRLREYFIQANVPLPTVNPDYDPYKDKGLLPYLSQ